MGSRKLPKMVREIGAPADLPASIVIEARAGIDLTTVICAGQEKPMNEAPTMHRVLRRSDIRMRPRANDVR